MSAFNIKIIAIVTMLIDHVGLFFFPDISLFRIIGRLSFPLFAWLIANGAYHTKNIDKYLLRLGIFAVISQIPYTLAHRLLDSDFARLNILFTLFLGLFAVKLLIQRKLYFLFFVIAIFILAMKVEISFGLEGILSIAAFYFFFRKQIFLVASQILIFFSRYFYYTLLLYPADLLGIAREYRYFAPLSVLSLPIIFQYNGKRGRGYKYLFYVIYPLQYVFYYIIKLIL